MDALRYIRMVLWSFFGIRRRSGAEDEISRAHPIVLVLTALALAGGFIAVLVWLAGRAASGFG